MRAAPRLRDVVSFSRVNLVSVSDPIVGRFDYVFGRNVLIDFDAETRARVIDRLLGHLRHGGLLFLGDAESLGDVGTRSRVRPVAPNVYAIA